MADDGIEAISRSVRGKDIMGITEKHCTLRERGTGTPSTLMPPGTDAPFFDLPGCDGNRYRLDDFASAPAQLAVFICNHCPCATNVRGRSQKLIAGFLNKGNESGYFSGPS